MLSQNEIEGLYEVLHTKVDQTLENCTNQFTKHFGQDTQNYFKQSFTLMNLFCENLLVRQHRLITIFLIIDVYKVENLKANPFIINLIDACEMSGDQFEKRYIFNILIKQQRDHYAKMTIKNLCEEQERYNQTGDEFEEVKKLKKQIQETLPKIQTNGSMDIKATISDFNYKEKIYHAPKETIPIGKVTYCENDFVSYGPDFIRPIPQIVDLQNEDLQWINPGMVHEQLWDYNICTDNNMMSVVKELMNKSYKNNLSQEESKAFEKDQNVVNNCGLTPALLPELVEKNAPIASTILIKMTSQPQISQYYEKLINMELTLSSLEVVNKLAQVTNLPKEFLNFYICNCIQQCEEKDKKEKNSCNRLVRLVCVFIKSMIKHKIINPKDMFLEFQAFCIEFSKISEASSLFKILKSIDSNEGNRGNSNNTKQ